MSYYCCSVSYWWIFSVCVCIVVDLEKKSFFPSFSNAFDTCPGDWLAQPHYIHWLATVYFSFCFLPMPVACVSVCHGLTWWCLDKWWCDTIGHVPSFFRKKRLASFSVFVFQQEKAFLVALSLIKFYFIMHFVLGWHYKLVSSACFSWFD